MHPCVDIKIVHWVICNDYTVHCAIGLHTYAFWIFLEPPYSECRLLHMSPSAWKKCFGDAWGLLFLCSFPTLVECQSLQFPTSSDRQNHLLWLFGSSFKPLCKNSSLHCKCPDIYKAIQKPPLGLEMVSLDIIGHFDNLINLTIPASACLAQMFPDNLKT